MRALRGLKASPPHECEGSHLKSKSEAPNLNAGFAREFCAYLLAVLLAGLAALLSPVRPERSRRISCPLVP